MHTFSEKDDGFTMVRYITLRILRIGIMRTDRKSQASEHAAQPPTTEKPSTQRPESRQRYLYEEFNRLAETRLA